MGLTISIFWQLAYMSNPAADFMPRRRHLHHVKNNESKGMCSDWEHRSNTYIQAVHDNPEQMALNNWTLPTFETSYISRVFAGKRVALMGDSTLCFLRDALHNVLNVTNPQFLGGLQNMTLTGARQAFDMEAVRTESDVGLNLRTPGVNHSFNGDIYHYNATTDSDSASTKNQHTQLMFTGFRGDNFQYNCLWEEHAFSKIRSFQPDILVANFGIHLFHHSTIRSECLVRMWLNYEEWLQEVVKLAEQTKVKLLLFKTTNYICEDRYPPGLREPIMLNKTTYVSICRGWFDDVVKHPPQWGREIYNFTDEQIDRYCWEASGRDANSRLLNQRMRDFVTKIKQKQAAEASVDATSSLRIEIYNDHDMQTCRYTPVGDGSHYRDLFIPRIRLLAHMIHCLWKED